MNTLQLARLLVVAVNVGVIAFAVALLCVQKIGRKDQALLLAAFLALYGLVKIHQILQFTGAYLMVPHLSGVVFPIMMLLGPTVYLYARAMTAAVRPDLTLKDAWLLIGLLVELALNAPYWILSSADKVALIAHHATPPQLETAHFRYYILYFSYLLFSIVCLVAALSLLLHHIRRLLGLFSNIENKSLSWLRAMLFILAAGWSCDVVAQVWSLSDTWPIWLNLTISILELGWIAAIAFFGVLQQPVYELAEDHRLVDTEKYARSALSHERMTRIAAKLGHAMTRDSLFEEPELSLRTLSDQVGVSENYVSQTLNDYLGMNFFDFVNGYRVSEACRRLEETSEPIVAIAFAVGFQSRSTFNAAFKRHAGRTPREHRAVPMKESNPAGLGAMPPLGAARSV